MTAGYPLSWPDHIPRSVRRERGAFKTSLTSSLKNVEASVRLFAKDSGKKMERVVISSNVSLGREKPDDPGVSVWFVWDGISVCIPIDRYDSVAANLQAIHHVIEARRTELRHGTLALVRASFQGFAALPAPPKKLDWWVVLGAPKTATAEEIELAYRLRAKTAHPDAGGSVDAMAALNEARDRGRQQRR